MTSLERIRKYIRTEVSRLDREITDVRARAEAAEFDDLREGLTQYADDLAEEADVLMRIWN
ncbi:MAG: hypothetical protein SVR04_00620, partial [Spirochaetota bacterium]|nr:hypothetical protein [Spirochaetota bacterium]